MRKRLLSGLLRLYVGSRLYAPKADALPGCAMPLTFPQVSTILKTLQEGLKSGPNEQPLSGHSFRVGAALDLLEQGETVGKDNA